MGPKNLQSQLLIFPLRVILPHSVESTSIAMVTGPHSRILISASPGARNGVLLDGSLFPPVLTSEIKLMDVD